MAIQVILSDLSFSYSGAVEVLQGASLSLTPGWTAVVGENGSGKTTLLRILAGELAVDPSMLRRIPAEQVVRYCPQKVGGVSAHVRELAERWDGRAERLKGVMALSPSDLTRWPSLSPGERKRWQIGAALVDSPDLLLLDEPTNHLDTEARDVLVDELRRFHGVGVLVSHDRELLDLLTTRTLRFSPGAQLRSYPGSYSEARVSWVEEAAQALETMNRLQATRRKLKKQLAAARQSHRAADKKTSTGSRMKSVRDSDARSMGAKGRAASGERSVGRRVTLLRREAERAEEALAEVKVHREVGRSVFLLEEPAPKPTLLHLTVPAIRKGGRILLRKVDITLRRNSRVHLKGPNGSGKTTLIREVLRALSIPRERVLYLPQELSREENRRNREQLRSLSEDKRGRLLQIVAALGVPPERLIASEDPSPGEARKLALAMGLSRQAWLLMLDEPTNHMDLPSIERMEEALSQYRSALLLVTHDARLAETLTSETWTIRNGRVLLEARMVTGRTLKGRS